MAWVEDVTHNLAVSTGGASSSDFQCLPAGSGVSHPDFHEWDAITLYNWGATAYETEWKLYMFMRDSAGLVDFGNGAEQSTKFQSCVVGGTTPRPNWRVRLTGASTTNIDPIDRQRGISGIRATNSNQQTQAFSLSFSVTPFLKIDGSVNLWGGGINDYAYGMNPRFSAFTDAYPENEFWADWHISGCFLNTIFCGSTEVQRGGATTLYRWPQADLDLWDPQFWRVQAYESVYCANAFNYGCDLNVGD